MASRTVWRLFRRTIWAGRSQPLRGRQPHRTTVPTPFSPTSIDPPLVRRSAGDRRPSPVPVVLVKCGSNLRQRLGSIPSRCRATRHVGRFGERVDRERPWAGIACGAFSMMLASARAIRCDRRRSAAAAAGPGCRSRSASSPVRYGLMTSATGTGDRPARLAVGDDAKLENSAEIWRSSHCPRIARRSSRAPAPAAAAFACTRSRCSADNWIGVNGFLISCATCRAISAQASSRCVRSSCVRCALSSDAMLLNESTRRRSSSAERTAMRASKSPAAIRRVARVSRRTGSAMRSASDRPMAAPRRTKHSTARCTPRSRSSISRSISRWRWRAGR